MKYQKMQITKINILSGLILIGLLALCFYSYSFGLNGLFIFDDISNLSVIGQYKELSSWDNFWLFLLEGRSGPTGRPLSLASFYLNDSSWPSDPANFTYTNVLIHLFNTVLVFWLTYKITDILNIEETRKYVFALLATALWALHPIHSTTVLYIIQRMTELSATFTLAGLLFYLYGRQALHKSYVKGFILLFPGVGISLVLAILSKENGALLLAYILCIEYFLIRPLGVKPPEKFHYWIMPAVTLPFLLLIAYMLKQGLNPTAYISREFTLEQRLMSEARILFDYTYNITIPNIQGNGIFHDDYIISKDILTPWTTLPAVVGWVVIVTATIFLRKKSPILAFAVAWFIAGHLMESTVLPLELYFEHRNYLPALGITICAAWYLSKLFNTQKLIVISTATAVLGLCLFLVIQSAKLWSNPPALAAVWYEYHPKSARLQEAYQAFFTADQAHIDVIDDSSSYMTLWSLEKKCRNGNLSTADMATAIKALEQSSIQNSAPKALISFMKSWSQGKCAEISKKDTKQFLLQIVESNSETILAKAQFVHVAHYWLSEIYLLEKNLAKTMQHLGTAYKLHPSMNLLLLQAKYLASAGLKDQALNKLSETEALEKSWRKRLIFNMKYKKLEQLRQTIERMPSA